MLGRFEVGVFNAEVRAALKDGERHKELHDEWADIHYIEVRAPDQGEARARIERRYPPALGYVVTGVVKLRG
jgi:hypothetical protein